LPVENNSSYTGSRGLTGHINKIVTEPPLSINGSSPTLDSTVQSIQDRVDSPSDNRQSDQDNMLNDKSDKEQPELYNRRDFSTEGTQSNTEDDIIVSSPPINTIDLSITGDQSNQMESTSENNSQHPVSASSMPADGNHDFHNENNELTEDIELNSHFDWDFDSSDSCINQNATAVSTPDVGYDNNKSGVSEDCCNRIDPAQTHEFIVSILPHGDDPCLEHPPSIHPNGAQINDTLPVITVKRKCFLVKYCACTNNQQIGICLLI
jgi:hypothetical protein